MRRRLDLIVLLLLAVLTNFTFLFASNGDFFFPDSATYLRPAHMLLGGHGFATKPGVVETLRTPVYPIFLIPFVAASHSSVPIVFTQHLIVAGLTAAIWLFVLRRTGNRLIAFVAGLLFAVDTPTIHYANKVLTETLFTALLFLAFILALRRRHLVILGLLLGVLTLTRPVAIAYFVVVAIFLFVDGERRRTIAAFVIAAVILPLAWAARNRIETGVFTVSTVASSNFLAYRAAAAVAIEQEGDFAKELDDAQKELIEDVNDQVVAAENVDSIAKVPDAVRSRYVARYARRVLLEHPRGFALVTLRGLMVNLFDSDWDMWIDVSHLDERTIEIAIEGVTCAVAFLAFLGIWVLRRSDRPLAILIALTIGYFIVISAGGESESRFRVPVVPYLTIAAAVAVQRIASASRMRTPDGG